MNAPSARPRACTASSLSTGVHPNCGQNCGQTQPRSARTDWPPKWDRKAGTGAGVVSTYRLSVATSKRASVNLARFRRLEPVRVQRAEKEDTDGKQDRDGPRCETPVSARFLSPGEHREGDQANDCEKRRQPDELRGVHPEQPTDRTDYPRVMSRRSTPERIDEARRAATRNRLMG
jgi:hypothetical protein